MSTKFPKKMTKLTLSKVEKKVQKQYVFFLLILNGINGNYISMFY